MCDLERSHWGPVKENSNIKLTFIFQTHQFPYRNHRCSQKAPGKKLKENYNQGMVQAGLSNSRTLEAPWEA